MVCCAKFLERVLREEELSVVFCQFIRHRCLNNARADADHSYSILTQVSSHRKSQGIYSSLGASIGSLHSKSLPSSDWRDIDDHSFGFALVLGHILCGVCRTIDCSMKIYLKSFSELLKIHCLRWCYEWFHRVYSSCTVNEDVDSGIEIEAWIYPIFAVFLFTHVSFYIDYIVCPQDLLRFFKFL